MSILNRSLPVKCGESVELGIVNFQMGWRDVCWTVC